MAREAMLRGKAWQSVSWLVRREAAEEASAGDHRKSSRASERVTDSVDKWATELAPFIRPVENLVADVIESEGNVIVEGAQGALLDLDHGTYAPALI